jgi:hypothetical protein
MPLLSLERDVRVDRSQSTSLIVPRRVLGGGGLEGLGGVEEVLLLLVGLVELGGMGIDG